MMTASFQTLMAAEHGADLRRDAEHRQLARAVAQPAAASDSPARVLALRLAHADEADVVRELAELDDAPALEGEVLLAFVDGKAIAGLSLRDRRVVATPFVPTSQAVALLQVRAGQLLGRRRRRRLRVLLRPRLA
jgi:hypothetical protein